MALPLNFFHDIISVSVLNYISTGVLLIWVIL